MSGQKSITITVAEAAGLLGISRDSAYKAAKSGELPIVNAGRRIVVLRPALERLIAEGNIRPRVMFDMDVEAIARKLRILELKSRIQRDQVELMSLQNEDTKIGGWDIGNEPP